MICPGAGQLYNKSYWKVPIVVGAFATMGYVIDWNARGYKRYRTAYNQVVNGQPDEFEGRYSADYLKNMKDNFRRNRDLCIILTDCFISAQYCRCTCRCTPKRLRHQRRSFGPS